MKRNLLASLVAVVALLATSCSQKNECEKLAPIAKAIEVAEAQMVAQAAEFADSELFPRSLMPKFRGVDAYDWTSGFFPGSLWLTYRMTGNEALKEAAEKYTELLYDVRLYKGTHDLGFMMYCSYGNQYAVLKDQHSADVIVESAKSLASRFNPEIGLIRSWDFGEWNYPVIIDNMMNLEMLFWASDYSGDKSFYDIAVCHADITMKNHYRDDMSSYHVVSYNNDGSVESQGTFQGYSDSSAWARGQAWGLYGYTLCYRFTKDVKYLEQAQKIAAFLLSHPRTPEDLIPYWDYDVPEIPNVPRDASAAAVMASALFELSTMTEGEESRAYFDRAERTLFSLCSEQYLAKVGENGNFIIKHCVGHHPANSEIDTPLNYGDYYFLECVERYLTLKGIDPLAFYTEYKTK